ncbi:WD repeat-containing protein, putative [Entamoeba invadens IP1]|uniref:WD repeat-containing protein, putative n=1 Tax=Entamoeba invadens IP1 TaxID=370355 RepID=UPI0002C3DCF2|nr:WD repeat-containing protein, putative [Entamoeba invadens IP1]ELP85294.1 WD repeat-containing protein, putative [Entamoeba invadens IP1]|eukprot:XP_004184640.1 WD repeat-containing protein, putative [Entamoeba invadens IP1]
MASQRESESKLEYYRKSYVYAEANYEYISSAFSYDGEVFVSSCGDNKYRVHTVSTPKTPTLIDSPILGTGKVAFTHNHNTIVSSFNTRGLLNSFGLFDLYTKEFVRLFHGHTDEITSLEHSISADIVLTASADGHVMVWDIRTNNANVANTVFQTIPVANFNADGSGIVVVEGQNLEAFDLRKFPYNPIQFLQLQNSYYPKLKCSLDGKRVAVSAVSGSVSIIDAFFEGKPVINTFETRQKDGAPEIEFSPEGSRMLYSNGFDGSVNVYNFTTNLTSPLSQSNQTTVQSIKCNLRYPLFATSCSVVNWWTVPLM